MWWTNERMYNAIPLSPSNSIGVGNQPQICSFVQATILFELNLSYMMPMHVCNRQIIKLKWRMGGAHPDHFSLTDPVVVTMANGAHTPIRVWRSLSSSIFMSTRMMYNTWAVLILYSYTLSREYRVMRNQHSWLYFTNEDRRYANLRVREQSTNMMSQCQ